MIQGVFRGKSPEKLLSLFIESHGKAYPSCRNLSLPIEYASFSFYAQFVLYDCGEMRHWVDIVGTIERKLAMRLMRKCGCGRNRLAAIHPIFTG